MRVRKEYDPQKDWKERSSTAVAAIIAMIVSLVLFVTGMCLLFTWVTNTETDKKLASEEREVIRVVSQHYGITAEETSKCVKIKQDTNNGTKWYIVSINGRLFKAEYHMEDTNNIYNLEEIEI